MIAALEQKLGLQPGEPLPPYGGEEAHVMSAADTTRPVLNLDADQDNADWPKRSWDLDIDNVEELRAFLGFIGVSAAVFRTWLVYRWNVDMPGMEWLRDL